MANIVSVIQPGGPNGTQYNMRATGIRHFLTNQPSGSPTPTEGCVSLNGNVVRITCAQITELFSGLMFSADIPSVAGTGATLKINSLEARPIVMSDGSPTTQINGGNTYLIVYNGTSFVVIDSVNTVNDSSDITDGSYNVPTANAVYDFVTSKLSNRWSYVIPTTPAETPAGAEYINGSTTFTGALAASSNTMYKIYLVKHDHTTAHGTSDAYDEWITLNTTGSAYAWEKIGNTDIDIADIASGIADTIIGSIADHTYVKVNSATVDVGSHDHTFNGETMVSTGNFTPSGTIGIYDDTGTGTSYTPDGSISVGVASGASYTPSGSVSSSFTGGAKYINVTSSEGTVSVSAANVTTGNNSAADCSVEWGTGANYSTTTPTATISGKSDTALSTNTSSDGSHTHTISGNGTSSAINGSSFTVSTESAMAVTIQSAAASASDRTFQVPISSAIVTTQPAYSSASSGNHTHIGTVNQKTLSGTLNSTGSASSYTVSGEVLTLTPGTVPGSGVTVTLSTTAVNIASAGSHSHDINQDTDAVISVTGGNVKLTASTPSHNHTLSGTVTPTITMGGTISTAGGHYHNTAFTSAAVAGVLNATVSQIGLLVGVGDHTHKIMSLSASGSFTPTVTVNTNTTGGIGYVDITPSGSVNSSFTGTETKLAFIGSQVKFAFKGNSEEVSVAGTTTGTVASKTIGSKSVSLSTTNETLTHTLNS